MNRESELHYVNRHESVDNSNRWNREAGYFRGLGDDTTTTDTSTWVDAIKEVLPAVASVYQQDQFNKANIALINQGKPPMSAQQYMATQPPTANVVVGPNSTAQKALIYGGIALLAIVGLKAAKVI
jgi:hypothetical protein